ncbi:MAG: hypothetical protein HYT79_03470 [Elusimicrobia bacterium]|nr:hypothetical protein [Elusimicrobiota bacterium]
MKLDFIDRWRTHLIGLILSSMTIVIVIFLIWELLEYNLFSGLDIAALHVLYITRGIALSVVLTAWSVWFIMKYRRRYEEEQKKLAAQLYQAEKLTALGQLVSGVVHEINNPIGIMVSRLELMSDEAKNFGAPDGHLKDIEVVRKQASRIGAIAQNLLSFAKKTGAQYADLDLNQVVAATISLIDHEFKKKEIVLDCRLAPSLPAINGNFNQLQQVLLNLLSNARDALGNGNGSKPHARPAIRIATWKMPEENFVRLSVIDNGPGIKPESARRVFDPFYTTKPEGTGLGLSVSYGIIHEHGGNIVVANNGEKRACGTCFMVTLPVRKERR